MAGYWPAHVLVVNESTAVMSVFTDPKHLVEKPFIDIYPFDNCMYVNMLPWRNALKAAIDWRNALKAAIDYTRCHPDSM